MSTTKFKLGMQHYSFIAFICQECLRILRDETRWTQNCSARTAEGYTISCEDPRAVSFCMIGAERRALHDNGIRNATQQNEFICEIHQFLQTVEPAIDYVDRWNDSAWRRFSDVQAVFTKAMEHAIVCAREEGEI